LNSILTEREPRTETEGERENTHRWQSVKAGWIVLASMWESNDINGIDESNGHPADTHTKYLSIHPSFHNDECPLLVQSEGVIALKKKEGKKISFKLLCEYE